MQEGEDLTLGKMINRKAEGERRGARVPKITPFSPGRSNLMSSLRGSGRARSEKEVQPQDVRI